MTTDEGIPAKLDRAIELLEQLTAGSATNTGEKFWALEGLRERSADPSGEVMIVGAVTLPAGASYDWQLDTTTESLLETDWAERVEPLRALGHPVRLALLQAVVRGQQETAALASLDGVGTTGQLHHHLRLLVSAGWLQPAGRGRYEVPAPRVIPLLAILMATSR